MLIRKGGRWELYPKKVFYKNNGEQMENWTLPSSKWWEDTIAKHDHLELIEFIDIELNQAQLDRYDEIKNMPGDFLDVYINYVLNGDLTELSLTNHPFNIIVLKKGNQKLVEQNVSSMLAMTDMFEENLKLKQQNVDTMIALTEMYEMIAGGSI